MAPKPRKHPRDRLMESNAVKLSQTLDTVARFTLESGEVMEIQPSTSAGGGLYLSYTVWPAAGKKVSRSANWPALVVALPAK